MSSEQPPTKRDARRMPLQMLGVLSMHDAVSSLVSVVLPACLLADQDSHYHAVLLCCHKQCVTVAGMHISNVSRICCSSSSSNSSRYQQPDQLMIPQAPGRCCMTHTFSNDKRIQQSFRLAVTHIFLCVSCLLQEW